MKEADEKLSRSGGDAWRLEKKRLQDQISDKESEIARLKKAEEFYMEEISSIKREVSRLDWSCGEFTGGRTLYIICHTVNGFYLQLPMQ